jgi:hypothetical protein
LNLGKVGLPSLSITRPSESNRVLDSSIQALPGALQLSSTCVTNSPVLTTLSSFH